MGKSESEVQQEIMIEAAKHGITLTRNNVGAGEFIDEDNQRTSYVRFGLWNDSQKRNKVFKSSDLVGIWPCNFMAPHGDGWRNVVVGAWVCVEVKREGWLPGPQPGKSKADLEREAAQEAYLDFMRMRGAIAGFCSSVDDFRKLICR